MRQDIEFIRKYKDDKGNPHFEWKQIKNVDHTGQALIDFVKEKREEGWMHYKSRPRPKNLEEFVMMFYADLSPRFIKSKWEDQIVFDVYKDIPRRVANMVDSILKREGGRVTFELLKYNGQSPKIYYMTREQLLLDRFMQNTQGMDIDPLVLDKFFHDGFYESMGSVENNIDKLGLFLREYYGISEGKD